VNVQLGQYLQPGQMLFSIVSMEQPWVVANFKETQMAKIRPGLKVTLHIDAYPGHEFEAKVASISPATGAKFALLPPDNASGNFVKTVQRMPVRIEFTSGDAYLTSLRAGMNAMVDVHID
jgi:membrane fusion protein (multidrug efflux system)